MKYTPEEIATFADGYYAGEKWINVDSEKRGWAKGFAYAMNQRSEKERKLNELLERINDVMWNTFMINSGDTDTAPDKIMSILEEWAAID